jgi:yecA family protein
MDLSMLDGFLCAVASAPKEIPEAQWLGKVLGPDAPSLFSAAGDDDRLVTLLRAHARDIVRRLEAQAFEPIVDRRKRPGLWSIAVPWCGGYADAISLRQSAWDRFVQRDEHARFLVPILGLAIPPNRTDLHPPSSRDRRDFERHLGEAAQLVYNAVKHPDEMRAIRDEVKRTIEPARAKAPARTVHRLQISLRDVRPRVWRRLEIASDVKLPQLSRALLAAMGWTDSHLHQFVAGGTYYGTPDPDFPSDMRSERSVTLARIAPEPKDRLLFEYDFGDGWRHTVTVEAIVEPEPNASYPLCTGGARACPPEDCTPNAS